MKATSWAFHSVIVSLLILAGPAEAQSLHVQSPAPLSVGANQGTVDSFVGSHFWAFTVLRGRFHLVFTGGTPQEGFAIGGRAAAGMAFAPASRTSHFTVKESAESTVFDGVVDHAQRVVVEVDPRNSPLVRQTTDYTLTLSGDIAAAEGSAQNSADNGQQIVGIYVSKISDAGAVRFSPDGSILASNGARGTWRLFDAQSRIYSFDLGGVRYTATLSPGRGLIDSGNHNLIFEMQR